MVVSVVAAARLVRLVIWATAFWPCTVCLSSDTVPLAIVTSPAMLL